MSGRSITIKKVPTNVADTVIEVTVDYDEGGLNYFHGTTRPRGFAFSATVWTIRDGMRTTVLGTGGLRRLIEPAKRYNAKRLAAIAAEAKVEGSEIATKMQELVKAVLVDKGMTEAPPLAQLGAEAVA